MATSRTGLYAVKHKKRPRPSTVEPKAWWQLIAGERLPHGMFDAKSKCDGRLQCWMAKYPPKPGGMYAAPRAPQASSMVANPPKIMR
jgi:hypothetical protein